MINSFPKCLVETVETYQFYSHGGKKLGLVRFKNTLTGRSCESFKNGDTEWKICDNGWEARRNIGAFME